MVRITRTTNYHGDQRRKEQPQGLESRETMGPTFIAFGFQGNKKKTIKIMTL